ncbi:MAG: TIGR00730 family Rossman fold protein [bacterium]
MAHELNPPASGGQAHPLLTRLMTEGHATMPHKDDRPPLVCKPARIEPWRIFRIMSEFVEGFEILKRYGLAASIFGTARASFEHPVYQEAEELAAKLAKRGFAIITGGSKGVMEAGNKGAFQAGGASVGLNIHLPEGQGDNAYLTEKFEFEHFFVRKVMLTFASEVYIYFPGGFGTWNEFFEIVTLIQTKKIRRIPVVLVGKAYWTPLTELIRAHLYKEHKAIDEKDMDIYKVVDSVDEAYDYIVNHVTC